jgi:hypothetical protein
VRFSARGLNSPALTAVLLCRVDVFPLQVARQRKSRPEKDQRVTEWFTPAEAVELVHEPELSELIRAFEAMISRGDDMREAA